ncbi:hypothetical protein FOZ61_002986 [Perkinsus olseni]|uniref:Peptidase A1 domain-containing protein n=1 Tax=Perkinsus olseni TaxID=32597 RepID=A0A7J6LR10_PEROL|nr:hypothetical protein FOZ61_002986 [Perkinsus olseni]
MSQLQGTVASTRFALYLRKHRCGAVTGELLLGGGDPSLYEGPLRFTPLRGRPGDRGYRVTVGMVRLGQRTSSFGDESGIIDTRAEAIFAPSFYFRKLVPQIFAEASASAGVAVNYQWVPGLELFVFDCAFMRFIPPIKMCLGEADDDQAVPIYVTNYARNTAGTCSLAFKLDPNEMWRLPAFVLVGTYFEFRPSEGKLGVARLA